MDSQNKLLKRSEIPEKYKWKLEDIYEDDTLWERDFEKVKNMLSGIMKFKGKLSKSPDDMLECFELKDNISRTIEKLMVYSRMRRDEDNGNSKYQALSDRIQCLSVEADREFSFLTPEILQIPESTINEFIKKEKGLVIYRHYMDKLLRKKEHVLAPEEEKIVSMTGEIAQIPETAYRMLSDADMKFPVVKDDSGDDVELSEGRYYKLIRSENREVRKGAFQGLYSTYEKYGNTFTAMLNGTVKRDIFYARVRNYNNSLESALFDENIPVSVYDNVLNTINDNLKPLHRYVELRKKILKIDKVHMYDLYTPLVKDVKTSIPFEEAVETVKESLKPLGEEYLAILDKGFRSRWVDVFENQGKTGGAYSWGSYDTNPYVLLNYSGTLPDVSTVAHEMGHSIHSYLTWREQPYIYSQYPLFSAEVASTTNEALLVDYMLKTTKDKAMRVYILNQHLEEIRTTVYRQTMFAEFEKIIHGKVENGEALTHDMLCSLWHDLNAKYYGPHAFIDEGIDIEWARIPHFYWNFYVFKYVTGYSAAMSISRKILDEGKAAVGRYFEFLKGGDSDYSINLLKKAGVDMTTPEPLINTIKIFEGLLDEIEKELEL